MKLGQCQGVKVSTPVLWAKVKTGENASKRKSCPSALCSGRLPVALAFFASPPPPRSSCLAFLPTFLSGRPTPAWGPCAWMVNGHLVLPRWETTPPPPPLPFPPASRTSWTRERVRNSSKWRALRAQTFRLGNPAPHLESPQPHPPFPPALPEG